LRDASRCFGGAAGPSIRHAVMMPLFTRRVLANAAVTPRGVARFSGRATGGLSASVWHRRRPHWRASREGRSEAPKVRSNGAQGASPGLAVRMLIPSPERALQTDIGAPCQLKTNASARHPGLRLGFT
jgi:hypothetical protein